MTRLEKIEKDISALSDAELQSFSAWFDAFKSDLWDARIKADAEAGKLDHLISRAKAQAAAGKVRPL